jgi:hypothetical protein
MHTTDINSIKILFCVQTLNWKVEGICKKWRSFVSTVWVITLESDINEEDVKETDHLFLGNN